MKMNDLRHNRLRALALGCGALLAGSFPMAAQAQIVPNEPEAPSVPAEAGPGEESKDPVLQAAPEEQWIDGKITAVGGSFVQLGASIYDLTDNVTVFDRFGNPTRINALRKDMDVLCRVVTRPDGSEVISEIRVTVR